MFLISETTVATRDWMFGGKEPPMPAASSWTLAAAALLALYELLQVTGVGDRQQPGRPVALVLQGLYQAGDLLSEVGEL